MELVFVLEQVLNGLLIGAAPVPFSIPDALRGQVFLGEFIYPLYRLAVLGVSAACVLGLWLLLTRTYFGRVVRAGVQDPDMVGALGISLKPYMTAVVVIAVGLAAVA